MRDSDVAFLPQWSKQQVLILQGEERGPASLKGDVSLLFFFPIVLFFSDQDSKNQWVTLFVKGKVSFQIFFSEQFEGVAFDSTANADVMS